MKGPVLDLVFGIVVVGALVWGLMRLPIDKDFQIVAKVVLVVALVIWAVYVLRGLI